MGGFLCVRLKSVLDGIVDTFVNEGGNVLPVGWFMFFKLLVSEVRFIYIDIIKLNFINFRCMNTGNTDILLLLYKCYYLGRNLPC